MGRHEIWSDLQIQTFTRNFVCVMDNVFFLNPPRNISQVPNPDSAAIFSYFLRTAPNIWAAGTGTRQGIYVLDPKGRYLVGKFAANSNDDARAILVHGWKMWQATGSSSTKVPEKLMSIAGGQSPSSDRVKLRVTYRDMPRGDQTRPSDAQFKNPYNLGWYDLSLSAVRNILAGKGGQDFRRLVMHTMKDAVRGEMSKWSAGDWREGDLKIDHLKSDGPLSYFRVESHVKLHRPGTYLSYSPHIFGEIVVNTASNQIKDIRLLAIGQRVGAGVSNGRKTDLGPAPMAVALRMWHGG